MGRIHGTLKEQLVLSVSRVLITAGNERVAACASTVSVRGAWKPTTAPAESRFAGRTREPRCRLGYFFCRDWQKVGRDHAPETEIRHEIALHSRRIPGGAGTGGRSGSCHSRKSEKKRNREHCFPHTLPPCVRPMVKAHDLWPEILARAGATGPRIRARTRFVPILGLLPRVCDMPMGKRRKIDCSAPVRCGPLLTDVARFLQRYNPPPAWLKSRNRGNKHENTRFCISSHHVLCIAFGTDISGRGPGNSN